MKPPAPWLADLPAPPPASFVVTRPSPDVFVVTFPRGRVAPGCMGATAALVVFPLAFLLTGSLWASLASWLCVAAGAAVYLRGDDVLTLTRKGLEYREPRSVPITATWDLVQEVEVRQSPGALGERGDFELDHVVHAGPGLRHVSVFVRRTWGRSSDPIQLGGGEDAAALDWLCGAVRAAWWSGRPQGPITPSDPPADGGT